MKNLLLKIITILLGSLCALSAATMPQLPNQDWDPNYISHGPMLGNLTDSSIRVWARTGRTGSFQVAYGTAADDLDQITGNH